MPATWLLLTIIAAAWLLTLPITLPIGPMYWDTYLYLDAAQRINIGQTPSVDFFTPVGPLGYYLFAWGLNLFKHAQPLLLAQWSLLAVAAPLMAIALSDVAQRNRVCAFALLIPFLVFALFPANTQFETPYPGLDGFGIYNRQTSLLLYVLMCGLLFLANGRKLAIFCAMTMLCLFLTKITGFLVGGVFGLIALMAGRISILNVFIATLMVLAILAGLELNTHIVSEPDQKRLE